MLFQFRFTASSSVAVPSTCHREVSVYRNLASVYLLILNGSTCFEYSLVDCQDSKEQMQHETSEYSKIELVTEFGLICKTWELMCFFLKLLHLTRKFRLSVSNKLSRGRPSRKENKCRENMYLRRRSVQS